MIPSKPLIPDPSASPAPPPTLDQQTIDQLANYILLTVQALQRLHAAFDKRFTR